MTEHPAFRSLDVVGTAGYTLPDFSDGELIEVSPATLPYLTSRGIHVEGPGEGGNWVYLGPQAFPLNLKVILHRRRDNIVVLDRDCRLRGQLNMQGDENIFVVGRAHADIGVSAVFRYHRAGLFLGVGGSSPLNNYWVEGPGVGIVVGDDFLMSWGLWFRSADSHAMVDLGTSSVINPSRPVLVGRHVWLGQDVIVMPGAEIGEGAIIGARSIVTKKIPPWTAAVGAPARVVRQQVSWTRLAHPTAEMIDTVVSDFMRSTQQPDHSDPKRPI